MNDLFELNRIFFLLAQHKKNVSDLYINYYTRFPGEDFWLILSESKQKNYDLIASLNIDTIKRVPNDSVLKSAAIKISLDWIARLIKQSSDHTLARALYYSLDLEQSKLEQKYLDTLKKESSQIEQLIYLLDKENRNHVAIIKHELIKIY